MNLHEWRRGNLTIRNGITKDVVKIYIPEHANKVLSPVRVLCRILVREEYRELTQLLNSSSSVQVISKMTGDSVISGLINEHIIIVTSFVQMMMEIGERWPVLVDSTLRSISVRHFEKRFGANDEEWCPGVCVDPASWVRVPDRRVKISNH